MLFTCQIKAESEEKSVLTGKLFQMLTIRSSTYNDLCVSRALHQTDLTGQHSLWVASPQLWNQLPVATRATSANTLDCFKQALKTLLFQ